MRRYGFLILLLLLPTAVQPQEPPPPADWVPMIFPVLGKTFWVDTFGADRDGGRRKHQGQDLMAPKLTPLLGIYSISGGEAGGRKNLTQGTAGVIH
ncbi:MAG: hypothetical protein FJX77_05905 [Armatimonadetes bacterium]|nr:hypothetical protein [Armatimonadota bacterium]